MIEQIKPAFFVVALKVDGDNGFVKSFSRGKGKQRLTPTTNFGQARIFYAREEADYVANLAKYHHCETQVQAIALVPRKEAPQQPQTATRRPQRGYSALRARPIMLYPWSPEERDEIVETARAEQRSLSGFIRHAVSEFIRKKKLGTSYGQQPLFR